MTMEQRRRMLMANRSLYPPEVLRNRNSKIGQIGDHGVGSHFADREQLSAAGVHPPTYAGIYGDSDGAYSIVMSGVKIDKDFGDIIEYTGTGGYLKGDGYGGNSSYKEESIDQSFEHPHNARLVTSQMKGIPVRVIRGYRLRSPYAPSNGYRYDGLYHVKSHFIRQALTADGVEFDICVFRMERVAGQEPTVWHVRND